MWKCFPILALVLNIHGNIATGQSLQLQPIAPLHDDWHSFETIHAPQRFQLEAHEVFRSSDLSTWEHVATAHHLPLQFADPSASDSPATYYKLTTREKTEADYWLNIVALPGRYPGNHPIGFPDFFNYPDLSQLAWAKFSIDLLDEGKVIYQNSRQLTFHYDFARKYFPRYRDTERRAFDEVSLFPGPSQEIALGAVILGSPAEVGVQFVGQTPYPIEQIAEWIALVGTTLNRATPIRLFYVPTHEQAALSDEDVAYLAQRGISVTGSDRWRPGNAIYSEGWAMGNLKAIAVSDIELAYAEGRLNSTDILLIDGVPAELPPVAGVLSLAPATDHSHVAILARASGIPFAYLREANLREQAASLTGMEIYFSANTGFFFNSSSNSRINLIPIDEGLPLSVRSSLLALKKTPELDYPRKLSLGAMSQPIENISLDHVPHVGGKAANYGFLRQHSPDFTPDAVALSFDLWDSFMDNRMPAPDDALTVRAYIANALEQHSAWPVRDMFALDGKLREIQNAIKSVPFTEGQRDAILEGLSTFDPRRKVRMRSSTNVEDGNSFSGAGLYDSYSGCIADDTDDDENGPSACDSERTEERGVFRAIRKVYASFYNLNAYLERLRHGVDENEVGMAILAHYSYPDETELANGVATVSIPFGEYREVKMVTQKGALSVANPDGETEPEIVSGFTRDPKLQETRLEQSSSLVTLGGSVMTWNNDYVALGSELIKIFNAYSKIEGIPDPLVLDYEFKKITPDKLIIKQVRPIPPVQSNNGIPFLLNSLTSLAVEESEQHSGYFGRHRIKSRWNIEVTPVRLDSQGKRNSFLQSITHEWMDGNTLQTITSAPGDLQNYGFAYDQETNVQTHSWTQHIDDEDATVSLTIRDFPATQDLSKSPVITIDQLSLYLEIAYPSGRPELVYDRELGEILGTTKSDVARLGRDTSSLTVSPRSSLQERTFSSNDGTVSVNANFYWPPEPTGPTAGYTAPNEKWVSTTISGVLDDPFSIHGFYSQTYIPGHHNFTENFMFEPERDPKLSQETLAALRMNNVRYLVGRSGQANRPELQFFGFDNVLRDSL